MFILKGSIWVSVLVVSAACAFAQEEGGGQQKLVHKQAAAPPKVSSDPVTQAEAKTVFKGVKANLSAVAGHKLSFGADPIGDSSQPVTREQILVEFDQLYKSFEPYVKFTPRPLWFDGNVLTIKSGRARAILGFMIRNGFVARVGTLATSPKNSMDIKEFGDSVGIFVARAADLTHMPKPGYTPFLQGGPGSKP